MNIDILLAAFNLTMLGMTFVFAFLVIFLLTTQLMSYTISKRENFKKKSSHKQVDDDISEETAFIIRDAIKQHINKKH